MRIFSLSTALALCIATTSCAPANDASSAKSPLVGAPAPEFAAESVAGDGPKSLKEAQGKVVILDFWATFCQPCKKSFPKYQEIANQFGSDVAVLAISVDDDEPGKREDILKFAKDTGVKFPVLRDKAKSAVKQYDPQKMPTSFIIDKQGVVRNMHAGYEPGEEAKIAEEVKALLGK